MDPNHRMFFRPNAEGLANFVFSRKYCQMNVIHPGLFNVITRYPAQKQAVIDMFKQNRTFRAVCMDYQDCAQALRYWRRSSEKDASKRESEYQSLLLELEEEIFRYLEHTS
jgi:hypothetical protein